MKQILIVLSIAALSVGCTTTKYVAVPEVHTEYVHHTDSVYLVDSIIKEKETLIMQLDSAAMAKYGIQLKSLERAWLIKTAELERQLQNLTQITTDTVVVHDSIPFPVPVEKEVPADLTWWQQARLHIANILLWFIALTGVAWLIRRKAGV